MKCPECETRNKTSIVYTRSSSRTELGFTASVPGSGGPHLHDPNKLVETFECSNGHRFKRESCIACPKCDFGHEAPVVTNLTPRAKFQPGSRE